MNIEKAKEVLKYSVQRNTPERYIVLDVIFQLNRFTKIELVDKVRELKNRVSVATVYNSIDIFENLGIIEHKRGDVYTVTPDSAIKTELNGLVETVNINIAETLEFALDSNAKIRLIGKLQESLPFEYSVNFFETLLNDFKDTEAEFKDRKEVLEAFDTVINSLEYLCPKRKKLKGYSLD